MIRTVSVGLGDRAYDVVIGPGLIDQAGARIAPVLSKRKRVAVVTDAHVGEHPHAQPQQGIDVLLVRSARFRKIGHAEHAAADQIAPQRSFPF